MSQGHASARVLPSGVGVEITDMQGSRSQLRYFDILRHLEMRAWTPDKALPQIQSALLEGNSLHLRLDEAECSLSLEGLHAEAARVTVLEHARVMTCSDSDLGMINDGSVVIANGCVTWVGRASELHTAPTELSQATFVDLQGRLVTPGLIDCHAHPLFAGQRADEFARRARGDHYLDIAKQGGGINATVLPTRSASINEHVELCGRRMQHALEWGTTTMEAKSGYDLSVEGELRLLRVAGIVDGLQAVDLMPTLLGAHAIPSEFQEDRQGFLASVIEEMIPRCAAEGLASAVDVYCDEGAFSLAETRNILTRAKRAGLAIKAHIGQFRDLGGPQLLAELGGLSGDHLEQISGEGIAAMAKAGVIATMLPGACVQLRMSPPPVARLRGAGVAMALASDLNPGTSHSENLALAMWLASTHYEMTVEEAWLGVTRNAAGALGRNDIGQVAPGQRADIVIWDAESYAEIPYHFGVNLVHQVLKAGQAQRY